MPNVDADGPGDAWVCIQDPAPPDAFRLEAFGFGVDGTPPTVCRDVPGAVHVENMMLRRKNKSTATRMDPHARGGLNILPHQGNTYSRAGHRLLPTNTRATRAFHGLLCLLHDGARYEWQAHRGTMENYQKIEKVGEGM